MKISELMRELEEARKLYGDIEVHVRHEDRGRLTSLPADNASPRRGDDKAGTPFFLIDT